MHYIIYVGQSKKSMDAAELALLLSHSQNWNTTQGLTSLLIYRYSAQAQSGHFIQMLEGEKSEVRVLFDKIKLYERHHTSLTLRDGDIESRLSSEWAMGFRSVDDALFSGRQDYARIGEASFDPATFQQPNVAALDLLKFFREGCQTAPITVLSVLTTRRTADAEKKCHQACVIGSRIKRRSHTWLSHRCRSIRHPLGMRA